MLTGPVRLEGHRQYVKSRSNGISPTIPILRGNALHLGLYLRSGGPRLLDPQNLAKPSCDDSRESQLNICFGLQVLAAASNGLLQFQDIFMFSHQELHTEALFVDIATASGTKIKASPDHYIWVQSDLPGSRTFSGVQMKLMKARDIHVGHTLLLAPSTFSSANANLTKDTVLETTRNIHQGLFNPHTASGTIVVDGLLASTFTSTIPPSTMVHALVTSPAWAIYQVAKIMRVPGAAGSINAGLLHAHFGWCLPLIAT